MYTQLGWKTLCRGSWRSVFSATTNCSWRHQLVATSGEWLRETAVEDLRTVAWKTLVSPPRPPPSSHYLIADVDCCNNVLMCVRDVMPPPPWCCCGGQLMTAEQSQVPVSRWKTLALIEMAFFFVFVLTIELFVSVSAKSEAEKRLTAGRARARTCHCQASGLDARLLVNCTSPAIGPVSPVSVSRQFITGFHEAVTPTTFACQDWIGVRRTNSGVTCRGSGTTLDTLKLDYCHN